MFFPKPKIFEQFPNVLFGFSTKFELNGNDPFNFNMSKSIGDSEVKVAENRKLFFTEIGLNPDQVIVQKQIHSDIVNVVDSQKSELTGDALITNSRELGLAVSTADCTNIYLYDSKIKCIAAVHSGWAGSEKKILKKTIEAMKDEFSSNPKNVFVYFGPSICQHNYEVGTEFLDKFDEKYFIHKGDRIYLDLKSLNHDILLEEGIPNKQIEISDICSFSADKFHSYRRDQENSGRALGVIALRSE